jgi:hypothetical protein
MDAGRMNADEHVVEPDGGPVDLPQLQNLG